MIAQKHYLSSERAPVAGSPLNWTNFWVGASVKRMRLEGKSPNTIDNYKRAIQNFTESFKKYPLKIEDKEIREYLYRFDNTMHYEPTTVNLHVSELLYFYNTVLGRKDKNTRNRLLLKEGYVFGLRVNRAVALCLSNFNLKRNRNRLT